MAAHTFQAVVLDDRLRLLPIREALEIGVAARRAELDLPDARLVHAFEHGDELPLRDSCADGIGLTADRDAERIGAECGATGERKPCDRRAHTRSCEEL